MKSSKENDQAPLRDAGNDEVRITRDGKDEMNLVEHPFALLSSKGDGRAVIELEWEAQRNGKTVQCTWRVAGDPEMGLPTPFDERLYLVMLELTREVGWPQIVPFRRTEVMRRLGVTRTKKNYDQLNDALTRLASVTISARNSFYNPKTKQYDTLRAFSLLDGVSVSDESGRHPGSNEPLSHFEWSKEFYASLVGGNVRTLDLDIALSLERPLALRLLRYLDKKRHDGKRTFKIGLRKLCELHLGMVPHKYESKYKDRLTPAHEELIARGFLDSVEFQKARSRGEDGLVTVYTFAARAEQAALEVQDEPHAQGSSSKAPNLLLQAAVAATVTPGLMQHHNRAREHEKHPEAYKAVWDGLEEAEREKATRFGLEWHEFLRIYHDYVLVKTIRAQKN